LWFGQWKALMSARMKRESRQLRIAGERPLIAPSDLVPHHLPSIDAAALLSAHEQRAPTASAEQILVALEIRRGDRH
jgi:hypothetical protein